jgi:hypothetical protein
VPRGGGLLDRPAVPQVDAPRRGRRGSSKQQPTDTTSRCCYRPIWSVYRPGSALLLLFLVAPRTGRAQWRPSANSAGVGASRDCAGLNARAAAPSIYVGTKLGRLWLPERTRPTVRSRLEAPAPPGASSSIRRIIRSQRTLQPLSHGQPLALRAPGHSCASPPTGLCSAPHNPEGRIAEARRCGQCCSARPPKQPSGRRPAGRGSRLASSALSGPGFRGHTTPAPKILLSHHYAFSWNPVHWILGLISGISQSTTRRLVFFVMG